jgi:uncharacterized protein (DUF697 family)
LSSSVSFSRFYKAFTEARDHTAKTVRVCVVGAGSELARVVGALSAGADDAQGGVSSALDALSPADFPRDAGLAGRWEIVVLVAAGCPAAEAAPVASAAHAAGLHLIALVEEQDGGAWARAAGVFDDEIARGVGGDHKGTPSLEKKIVSVAGDKSAALAAELPAVRRAYCDHVILTNATQNAVIGAVVIIPGADMPAMTANQIRMILKISAAYGEDLGLDRALEILSVVGSAFVFRALARQALDFVPGFGWALKGTVGFTATVALGQAAITYFEAGAPLRVSRMQRINRQLDRARSRLPGFLQRGLPSE